MEPDIIAGTVTVKLDGGDLITLTYHPSHGAWYERADEAIGSICCPANRDGSPALDDLGIIEYSSLEVNGGPCRDRCRVCLDALAKEAA